LILVPKIKTGMKIQINYLGNFTLGIKTKGFQYSGIIFQKKKYSNENKKHAKL
jgi:hypothetical protein